MQDNLRAARSEGGVCDAPQFLQLVSIGLLSPPLKTIPVLGLLVPKPRPFGSQSSTLCPSQMSQICHYVFVYVTPSFSSVGEEDSGNIERYAEVDRPPMIGAVI